MSGYIDVIKKDYNPRVESLRDDIAARKRADFFWPNGTQIYCGRQGSGKTISAVKHVLELKQKYPLAVIVSNLDIKTLRGREPENEVELEHIRNTFNVEEEYIKYSKMEQLEFLLTKVNNGYKGVIYVIDEIHTYFNALESKNIPMYVFTEISQQRKQRKLIVGTSQLFLRMAKPLREQCDNLIICNTVLGIFTITKAYDGMTLTQDYDGSLNGKLKKIGWFFHNRKLRNSYDTYQKVVSGAEQYEQLNQIKLVGKKGKEIVIK